MAPRGDLRQAGCRLRSDTGGRGFHNGRMDFNPSPLAQQMCDRLNAFIDRYVLPYNAAWHAAVQAGVFPPPFLE